MWLDLNGGCVCFKVRGIVDKATKELTMEKTLKELDKIWSEMEFEHEKHNRTGLQLLKTSEELVETLEENQVREKERQIIRERERPIINCQAETEDVVEFLGSTSKYDDLQICWALSRTSLVLAKELIKC